INNVVNICDGGPSTYIASVAGARGRVVGQCVGGRPHVERSGGERAAHHALRPQRHGPRSLLSLGRPGRPQLPRHVRYIPLPPQKALLMTSSSSVCRVCSVRKGEGEGRGIVGSRELYEDLLGASASIEEALE